jgi:hypothetical protein
MYEINKTTNRISKLKTTTFSNLGFRERDHLQEWIANNPESLGEELLIIQKEFSGFNDTNERLDLLALDKLGNIVVIENKLDDTGKDVTWQALKYASYCSTLTKDQIVKIYQDFLNKYSDNENAEENIADFLGENDIADVSLNSGQTQRIMLVAWSFRLEVTSTVLWLMNYKLRIQCFKATPFQLDEKLFINFEQIIPIKEMEEYVISMAEKIQDDVSTQDELKERHIHHLDFWKELLAEMNKTSKLFQNCSPSKRSWMYIGAGISGVGYVFVVSKRYVRVELYIDRWDKDLNKKTFDKLLSEKNEIESIFGSSLEWERLDTKKASRIKYQLDDVSYFNHDEWPKMIDFMANSMQKLEKALHISISKLN